MSEHVNQSPQAICVVEYGRDSTLRRITVKKWQPNSPNLPGMGIRNPAGGLGSRHAAVDAESHKIRTRHGLGESAA